MNTKILLPVILVAFFFLSITAAPVAAQTPDNPPAADTGLLVQLGGVAGFAALVALLIDALKRFGIVKDDQAQVWSAGLNLLLLAGLLAVRVYRPDMDIKTYDTQAQALAQTGMVLLGYFVQLAASKGTHAIMRGFPVIGTSFSQGTDTKE